MTNKQPNKQLTTNNNDNNENNIKIILFLFMDTTSINSDKYINRMESYTEDMKNGRLEPESFGEFVQRQKIQINLKKK